MPVTTRCAPVEVKTAPKLSTLNPSQIFEQACPEYRDEGKFIFDTSFQDSTKIRPASNGFVTSLLDAFLQHNHLVLRPDDVWFAILVQFSFYINRNAESLRKYFVNHGGKKKLQILQQKLDLPAVVMGMTELIAQNVKDPALRDWMMPSFSTTTDADKVTAAIIMMGSMQKYFSYFSGITCGIPSVTLLGTKKDWEDILERVQFFAQFGEEHEDLLLWNSVLSAIMSKFVKTFDSPDSPEVVHFWQRSVHYGEEYFSNVISGWVLGFCLWNPEGKLMENVAHNFQTRDWQKDVKKKGLDWWLEGSKLGTLQWDDVPTGYATVPIHLKLTLSESGKFMLRAFAGSVGWEALDSESVFAKTRGVEKSTIADGEQAEEEEQKEKHRSLLSFIKKKPPSGPSMLTETTLVEQSEARNHGAQDRGRLRQFIRQLWCWSSDTDAADDNAKAVAPSKPIYRIKETPVDTFGPRNIPQISDLSELESPWQYEKGGKHDAIRPVTGWWITKTSGTYGKDPDIPDVELDSDAEGYDDELARNGRPLN